MKNQILIPNTFLLGIIVGCFLLGSIIGSIITYFLLYLNIPDAFHFKIKKNKESIIYSQTAYVKKVIDGDTIVVDLKGKEVVVRYLGIDAPESKGKEEVYYAKESKEKNKELVEHKKVRLVWNPKKQYSSKRLLAYVYVGDTFVNAELLRGGYASVYRRNPKRYITRHLYSKYFEKLEQEARANRLGIWNIQKKLQWEKEHGVNLAIKPSIYIADEIYFHRPNCPKVKHIKFKHYYYSREEALKNGKIPCKVCKP